MQRPRGRDDTSSLGAALGPHPQDEKRHRILRWQAGLANESVRYVGAALKNSMT